MSPPNKRLQLTHAVFQSTSVYPDTGSERFGRSSQRGRQLSAWYVRRQDSLVSSKSYPLRLSPITRIMVPGTLAICTVVGFVIPFADAASGSAPPAFFALFWFGFLAFAWFQVLSLPQEILHHPDDTLEFRSLLRKRRVPIRELHVIEPVPNQFGFFRFRHSNGRIVALIHFDGFHELLTDIKAANPGVEMLGC